MRPQIISFELENIRLKKENAELRDNLQRIEQKFLEVSKELKNQKARIEKATAIINKQYQWARPYHIKQIVAILEAKPEGSKCP